MCEAFLIHMSGVIVRSFGKGILYCKMLSFFLVFYVANSAGAGSDTGAATATATSAASGGASGELAEDMLQMALRMASEMTEEPVMDLEDSVNPAPVRRGTVLAATENEGLEITGQSHGVENHKTGKHRTNLHRC